MDPIAQALLIGLPATTLGALAYARSRKVDAVAAQSGVATETRAGTEQIFAGLNQLVTALQADNQALREDVKYLNIRLDKVAAECAEIKKELDRLRRKYGDEG